MTSPTAADPGLVPAVSRRLKVSGWLANALGGTVVFAAIGFLTPVFAESSLKWSNGATNAPVVLAYFLVAGFGTRFYLDSRLRAATHWIREGREPSREEHRASLRLALRGVKAAVIAWAVAVPLLGVFNGIVYGWDFGALVAATIWLGGETTCALYYLDSERLLRPITAQALAIRQPGSAVGPGIRGRLLGAWALGTGVPLVGVVVVATVGLLEPGADVRYVGAAGLFLGVVALGAGLTATVFAAKAIAGPVSSVRRGVEAVEEGDLAVRVDVDDGSEVGLLQAGFNRMADGLAERERIRDLFGRQVGEDVARAALDRGTRLGGEERQVGAMFVDIIGSTSMAMAMPPAEVVRLLNRFFRVVVDVAESEGALVNKFEGDAALCVFGAPVPRDDPAGDALRSARALAERLTREMPEIDFGIGISAGEAVAGNVGAEHRFEYTVIGDPVNEASRLSDLAKQRPERVLASESALFLASAEERQVWEVTESGVLRGRNTPTGVAHPRR